MSKNYCYKAFICSKSDGFWPSTHALPLGKVLIKTVLPCIGVSAKKLKAPFGQIIWHETEHEAPEIDVTISSETCPFGQWHIISEFIVLRARKGVLVRRSGKANHKAPF